MDYIVARSFNYLYIILDIAWLLIFTAILLQRKKYTAIVVGLLAGIVYVIVDYGIFYRLLGTREVYGANTFLLLFWLSMSYGFTNFTWIWLLLDRDGHSLEWSLLPILGWLAVGLLSISGNGTFPQVTIQRQVASYHGYMAAILAAGYLLLIVHNLQAENSEERAPINRLLLIGIGVQLAWEAALLITGIRPAGIKPIVLNSLIETNLGMPYIYLIHRRYALRSIRLRERTA